MLISQLCSRYFQEHQPYICHSICWVKWLRSMAMLPLQCSRLYCQVSLCLAPLHIKQFIRKLCNKGSRDITFTPLFSPQKTQESLHVHYSPECLSNSQNHVADTSRFLENELGSSACCDHRIRSLWIWHSASEISDLNHVTHDPWRYFLFILLGEGPQMKKHEMVDLLHMLSSEVNFPDNHTNYQWIRKKGIAWKYLNQDIARLFIMHCSSL